MPYKIILAILLLISLNACKSGGNQTVLSTEPTVHLDSLRALGAQLASASQKALLAQVSQSLAAKGPVQTISFCHEQVSGIMDSLTSAAGAKISRISDRPRNPQNQAQGQEQQIMDYFKIQTSPVDTLIMDASGAVTYYKPIHLGLEACLQCHGTPGEAGGINQNTLDKLTLLYPQDQATNYKMGEVRGAWKIVFPEKVR